MPPPVEAPSTEEVQVAPKKTKNAGYAEWTPGETKLLLDYYERYFPHIGPLKKFKNKKCVFSRISEDLQTILKSQKTPEQCNTRLKTIQKRKRQAVSYNGRSGVGPVDVPYEDELDRISMMDDSIEPEVFRDVHGATHKKAMPSRQARAAAAAAAAAEAAAAEAIPTPADSAVASTSSTSSEESSQPASSAGTPHHSGRVNSARMEHMKEFFTEMAKLEEARAVRKARQDELKEERHAAKRKIKEEKCAAKRKLREEMRLERQEMHREKMRLLAMLVTQPETKQD
ncbi:hepatoma-derived growth factor-related protein 2-like [Ixodes scapularis]|uniref:hepatoma-derived growth factor-related protein 2-like n=1 Tax=Ixodes scapularis TaxID=6945 RepID=UPI001161AA93|nr:hepatoma-derived growth factor-related protein 2-like [Ixodes scapularis]